jgi:citronellol/citronellal dehydrogenase
VAGRLQDRVAIITGSSRGLGRYCAIGYGHEGATVVVAARSDVERNERLPGTIYETARLVEEAGGQALPVICNVADSESIQSMVKQVVERYGRIDILMANAAVQPPGGISTMEPRHWELEFRVNVHGTFHSIRAVLPTMIEQGSGNIVTISSVAALGGSHYGATKRAVESMSIGLSNELREKGIAVNCLKPVRGIETPGLMMSWEPGQIGAGSVGGVAPADSYVEAAVLMAMQTVDSCTGAVMTDAETVQRFADDATFQRYKAMNPPSWSESLS